MSLLSIDEMILKGWGKSVNVGAFSTPVAGGGAAAVYDIDRPRLAIGVPAQICIRPIRISAQIQQADAGNGEETEVLVVVDSLGLWRGGGGPTVETPSNLRTDLDKGSMCNCASIFTADMSTVPGYAVAAAADPVLDMELARKVVEHDEATDAGNLWKNLELVYEPDIPPFIVGPATLLVYFGADQACAGFVQAQWVEGPVDKMLPAV